MDRARGGLAELDGARTARLDAPSWLWSRVVDLLGIHERAYLEHCRAHALSVVAPERARA